MNHRKEIDGLRALAVVPVILFHAGFQSFGGGFVGVDVFFVISGYLITTIIISELDSGNFSLIGFYERRARRILPALFVVMICCLPFAWLLLVPQDMKRFSASTAAVALFISNHLFSNQNSYFDAAAELKPLLHTWSLAVEEQYYLLFPAFLLLTWGLGRRWIIGLLAIIFCVSLALAQWGSVAKPAMSFFILPMRGWELLIGAFSAFYLSSRKHTSIAGSAGEIGSGIGICLILYSIVSYDKGTPFPSLYTLAPTIGTALIILCASQNTVVGRFLSNKTLVGLGLVSYSAYLWHQPLFAFARYIAWGRGSTGLLAILAVTSFILAFFNWKYIETPFRKRTSFSRRKIFLWSIVGSVFFITFAILGYFTKGFESRLTRDQREVMSFESYSYRGPYREGLCFLRLDQSYTAFSEICKANNPENAFFIWGDSHAAALSVGLRKMTKDISQYNISGCPPIINAAPHLSPHCKDVNDFIMQQIEKTPPKKVILHAMWGLYHEQKRDPVDSIHKTIDYIKRVTSSTEIIVVGPVPQWLPTLPLRMLQNKIDLHDAHQLYNPMLKSMRVLDERLEAAAKSAGARYVSALNLLCDAEKCWATINYQNGFTLTAWDAGHLTAEGSLFLVEKAMARSLF